MNNNNNNDDNNDHNDDDDDHNDDDRRPRRKLGNDDKNDDDDNTGRSNNDGNNESNDGNNDDDDDDVDEETSVVSSSSSISTSSSLSSGSSELSVASEDETDEAPTTTTRLTLPQRQARNLVRNARFLADLHDRYKDKIPFPPPSATAAAKRQGKKLEDDVEDSEDEDEDDEKHNLQLLLLGLEMKDSHRLFQSFLLPPPPPPPPPPPTPTSTSSSSVTDWSRSCASNRMAFYVKELHQRYPHRQGEIRQLLAVLNANVSISNGFLDHQNNVSGIDASPPPPPPLSFSYPAEMIHVPSPIFCTGPKGCGKTSIVCDVVEVVQRTNNSESLAPDQQSIPPQKEPKERQGQERVVKAAYVDCSILEPSSVERLVYDIYRQLRPAAVSTATTLPRRKRNRRQRQLFNIKKRKARHAATVSQHDDKSDPERPRFSKKIVDGTMMVVAATTAAAETVNESRAAPNAVPPDGNNVTEDSNVATAACNSDTSVPVVEKVINKPGSSSSTQDQQQRKQQQNVRVLPSRGAKRLVVQTTRRQLRHSRPGRLTSISASASSAKKAGAHTANTDQAEKDDAVETSHSAVVSLGRSLRQYYGEGRHAAGRSPLSGILILDRAEELLSLSSSSKRKRKKKKGGSKSTTTTTNYLAELLLLPKIMKLNLTIIVISSYATLDKTRLNNLVAPSKSLGTISNGIHPIVVQFPAYKASARVFRDILTTPQNIQLVVGGSMASIRSAAFQHRLVTAFWNTVIQFVSDTTREVPDFLPVGRALWPIYVTPLHPRTIHSTMENLAKRLEVTPAGDIVKHPKVEEELVTLMGTLFYPKIATMASNDGSGLALMTLDESGVLREPTQHGMINPVHIPHRHDNHLSYLRSCLILAAFICQFNRADQDKKMFSSQANGKRRKRRAKEDLYGGNDEDVAFGESNGAAGRAEQLKSLRLRSFPLERVYSIFVSLVQFNPSNAVANKEDDDSFIPSLGSQRLYDDLSHFIDEGKLHATNYVGAVKGDQINFCSARFSCSVTKEEASDIAKAVDIPLEKYLL